VVEASENKLYLGFGYLDLDSSRQNLSVYTSPPTLDTLFVHFLLDNKSVGRYSNFCPIFLDRDELSIVMLYEGKL
jgi:hypothetical protein